MTNFPLEKEFDAGTTFSLAGCTRDHPDVPKSIPATEVGGDGDQPDGVLCVDPRPERDAVSAAAKRVRAGGKVVFGGVVVRLAGDREEFPTLDEFLSLLTTCGFSSTSTKGPLPLESLSAAALSSAGLEGSGLDAIGATLGVVAVIARTPSFGIGAAQPLRRKAKSKPATKVSLAALGGGDDDDDLVDESALVAESELLSKPEPVPASDGAPALKKACKNCTCGRAEGAMPAPTAVKLDADGAVADMPKSSCGSCYLGDGFRCAGCPYTGMPAFKPGEKVQLNLADDI